MSEEQIKELISKHIGNPSKLLRQDCESLMREAMEVEAKEFAEWVEKSNLQRDEDGRWFDDVNKINRYTTTELYNEFKKDKK